MKLFESIWMKAYYADDEKLPLALAKVEKLSQKKLRKAALESRDDRIRKAAAGRLADEQITSAFIQEAPDDVAIFLIDRTSDGSLLEQVLRESTSVPLKVVVLHQLSQIRSVDLSPYDEMIEDCLRYVYLNYHIRCGWLERDLIDLIRWSELEKEAGHRAIGLCSNLSLLMAIRGNDRQYQNKFGDFEEWVEFQSYLEQNLHRTIGSANKSELRKMIDRCGYDADNKYLKEAAMKRLISVSIPADASQEQLVQIAQTDPMLREAAFERLSDETFICKAVIATSDRENLKRIKDPELLKQIAWNESVSLYTRIDAAKLAGIKLTKTVPLYVCPDCGKPLVFDESYESIRPSKIEGWIRSCKGKCSRKTRDFSDFKVVETEVWLDECLLYLCPGCHGIMGESETVRVRAPLPRCIECTCYYKVPKPIAIKFEGV